MNGSHCETNRSGTSDMAFALAPGKIRMNQNIKSGKKILVQDTKRQDRLAAILGDDFFESENEIIDLIDGKQTENDNQQEDKKNDPANV